MLLPRRQYRFILSLNLKLKSWPYDFATQCPESSLILSLPVYIILRYYHAAAQWLRRRMPALSYNKLSKLFRKRSIRCHDPQTNVVHRAKKDQILRSGSRLLIPKAALDLEGAKLRAHKLAGKHVMPVSSSAAECLPYSPCSRYIDTEQLADTDLRTWPRDFY